MMPFLFGFARLFLLGRSLVISDSRSISLGLGKGGKNSNGVLCFMGLLHYFDREMALMYRLFRLSAVYFAVSTSDTVWQVSQDMQVIFGRVKNAQEKLKIA